MNRASKSAQEMVAPSVRDVFAASERIRGELWPIIPRRSETLSRMVGRDVWLIPESLQRTGSFKFRGALNRMIQHKRRGGGHVITASSGNHAIGLTTAAAITGLCATVVVPEDASTAKLSKLEALGASVRIMGAGFDEAEDMMFAYAREHDIEIVNSFDPEVIAGHGTVAMDALKSIPDLELLVTPVASGGLIAGCAVVMKAVSPASYVVGVQTEQWPAMRESLRAGSLTDVSGGSTVADGLAGNASRSSLPFRIIKRYVHDILLVSEESILSGVRHGLVNEQLVLEGAGAATIATLLDCHSLPGTGAIGLVLSGSNASKQVLKRAIG